MNPVCYWLQLRRMTESHSFWCRGGSVRFRRTGLKEWGSISANVSRSGARMVSGFHPDTAFRRLPQNDAPIIALTDQLDGDFLLLNLVAHLE